MPKQRLYLDESGDHSTKGVTPGQWDKRYLCLFGCSLEQDYCRDTFNSLLRDFTNAHFGNELDDPVILHREHIVAKKGPFSCLRDSQKNQAFCGQLLKLIEGCQFRAFAVVIDKISTANRHYGLSDAHPYHVGVLALLERYCGWLRFSRHNGDLLAEARGGREDTLLKAAYREIYNGGSRYYSPQFFQTALSTREIKLKPKSANIAGLQLADLLAYPAKRRILEDFGAAKPPSGFVKEVADVLERKYNRRYVNGQVNGYGKIFLS